MLNNNEHMNTSDRLRGMHDAKVGKPAEVGASDTYQDAYELYAGKLQVRAYINLGGRVSVFQ